ncbi:hypothetical protein V8E54_001751 [Elaphomyces granulatus]
MLLREANTHLWVFAEIVLGDLLVEGRPSAKTNEADKTVGAEAFGVNYEAFLSGWRTIYAFLELGRGRGGPARDRVQSTRSTRSTRDRSIPSTRSASPVPQGQLEESLDGRSAEQRRTPSPTLQPRPRSPRSSLSPACAPRSHAGTPFDTAAEAVADVNVTNFTIKARLDNIQNGPRPRFESADSTLRRVSRDTRWHAFLFHGKYYWGEILSQYFLPPGKSTENLPMDDDEVLRAKAKIFDAIKNIKSDTLKKFDSHVDQA